MSKIILDLCGGTGAWSKKYKDKWGYSQAKDININEIKCFKRNCFRPHDWNHDGHLVCITNANFGCPEDWKKR